MIARVNNIYTDEQKIFDSTKGNITEQILLAYPWLRSPYPEDNQLENLLNELDSRHYEVDFQPEEIQKSSKEEEENHHDLLNAMLGHNKKINKAFQTASFLAGRYQPTLQDIRRGLWQFESDPIKAALVAHKLEPSEANVKSVLSLQDLDSFDSLTKYEPGIASIDDENPLEEKQVIPFKPSGEDTARLIRKAFEDRFVVPVKLNGKHAKGTLLARENESGKTFLLKPGSNGQSPAAGAQQESATQSQREAAFFHEAELLGLKEFLPQSDLLLIDGKQYAAIQLLAWDFKTLDARRYKGERPESILKPYLHQGLVHRWGALDYIFGNPDRHANNIMVSDEGKVVLIDHGSAFAGKDFNPSKDQNSFTPFYLRAWISPAVNFNDQSPEQKLQLMPRLSEGKAKEIKEWVIALDSQKISELMVAYGIDPKPSVDRLNQLRGLVNNYPADLAILMLWADSTKPE